MLLPSESLFTWKRDDAVKIRMERTGNGSEEPVSVVTFVRNTVNKAANMTALGEFCKVLSLRENVNR